MFIIAILHYAAEEANQIMNACGQAMMSRTATFASKPDIVQNVTFKPAEDVQNSILLILNNFLTLLVNNHNSFRSPIRMVHACHN